MLKAGLHFGHIPSKRHPKMKPYIFGVRSGVHIIDLEQTQHLLDKALNRVRDIAAQGGVVLFVATKKQAQPLTKQAAEKCGMPYIHEHWIGGLLTNFAEIKKVIRRYNTLKKKYDDNDFGTISKKDKVLLDKEFDKLTHKVSGIATLTKAPEVIFMIDIKKEKTALAEASKMEIPVIAVCDSNTNPDLVTLAIPGNDDATKAIELIMNLVSEAVAEGKALFEKSEAAAAKKALDTAKKEKTSSKSAEKERPAKKEKPVAKIVAKKEDKTVAQSEKKSEKKTTAKKEAVTKEVNKKGGVTT